MSTFASKITGYVVGTWAVDPVHSDVSFTVRHLMVSKVRGHFRKFESQITTAENPLESSVTVNIDLASIDTGNEQRDNDLRSSMFLDIEHHPTMTFQSTAVREGGDGFLVDGDLSLHGVTRPVTLTVEVNGFSTDPWGGTRAGFSATTEISRKAWGIDSEMPMDGGGVVVGDKIHVSLEIEAILQPAT